MAVSEEEAGLRAAFRSTRAAAIQRGLRHAIVLALGCVPLFLALDRVQHPERAGALAAIRLGDAAVQLGLLLLLLRRARGARSVWTIGLLGPASASVANSLMALLTGGLASTYSAGPIFVILCTAILVPWPPAWMLLVSAVTTAAAVACAVVGSPLVDMHALGANLGGYAAATAIAVACAAVQERTRWRAFCDGHALADAYRRRSASEAQLRAILGSIADPLVTIDARGTIRSASASAATVLGWPPEELVGRHVHVLMPEAERDRQAEALAALRHAPAGLTCVTEIDAQRRDGTTFACEIALSQVERPAGEDALFTGILRDVSERRRSEQERADHLRLVEAIGQTQSRFIADADPRTLFRDLTETFRAATGSTYGFVGEILRHEDGRPYLQAHALTDISWNEESRRLYEASERTGFRFENLQTLFGAAITSGQPVIANQPGTDARRGGLPPGHPALDAFLGLPLYHGEEMVGLVGMANRAGGYDQALVERLAPLARTVAGLIWAHRNARERRHAEQAVAEQAEVAAALARVGQTLIASLDTPVLLERLCEVTTEVLACDSSHTLLWQAREDGFAAVAAHGGRPSAERAAVPAVPREMLGPLLADLELTDVAEVDHARVHAFLRNAGRPVDRPPGPRLCLALRRGRDVVGIQVAHRHTSERPFGERERRIAKGIAQLASMALANARLVEELERASRLKSEFVSTMSHELRTPLHVILGFTEMLRDTTAPAERNRFVDAIERAGRELLELIESTLEVGRIEAGRHELRLQAVALPVFWHDLEASCGMLPHASAVTLDWSASPPDTTLNTDPHKLAIVIRNLVGNAFKFTEQGSVQAHVEQCGDALRFRVRDTGIGIPPEQHGTIFEMFRQADGSDARRYGGTGLGLYIVRRFVELLGGTVALESAPGGGSTFTVTVPLAGPTAATSRAA